MTKIKDAILALMHNRPCCDLAAVRILDLREPERRFFAEFMPEAVATLALAHHITAKDEWTWYIENGGEEHCRADDHLKQLCERVSNELTRQGHLAKIVNYPGKSGLQFRSVAQAASLGIPGINAFLFHPAWGPWVHLRVLATTAELEIRPQAQGDQYCNACGLCVSGCPAKAISADSFAPLQCRAFRGARGEYQPRGSRGLLPYCLRCICVCPKGRRAEAPHEST